ncbi:MAG: hypothetical protein JNK72_00250 [Myxococcales bacterium]|nr:hypothetical protein [Myxococcales bacterium]
MKALTPQRVSARARVAAILRDTLQARVDGGDGAATQHACADRLGMAQVSFWRLLGDGDPAIALGDVVALGDTTAIAVLSAVIADLRARVAERLHGSLDLWRVVAECSQRTGELAEEVTRALLDHHLDDRELGQVDARLAAIEATVAQARALVAAHRLRRQP